MLGESALPAEPSSRERTTAKTTPTVTSATKAIIAAASGWRRRGAAAALSETRAVAGPAPTGSVLGVTARPPAGSPDASGPVWGMVSAGAAPAAPAAEVQRARELQLAVALHHPGQVVPTRRIAR